MAKITTGLRVEEATLRDLEALAALMTERAGGAKVTPTEAARAALTRGIAILRAELGGPAVSPKKGGKRQRPGKA
jgi:hypothetical protein